MNGTRTKARLLARLGDVRGGDPSSEGQAPLLRVVSVARGHHGPAGCFGIWLALTSAQGCDGCGFESGELNWALLEGSMDGAPFGRRLLAGTSLSPSETLLGYRLR
jgi:hypothetical protein